MRIIAIVLLLCSGAVCAAPSPAAEPAQPEPGSAAAPAPPVAAPATNQAPEPEPTIVEVEEQPDLYDIEMVIFAHNGQGYAENWPVEPGEPDRAMAIGSLTAERARFDPLSGLLLSPASREATLPEGMELLPRAALTMGPVVYTLNRRNAPVLLHVGWREAVADRGSPTWLWLESGLLRGMLRMSRGRYLHLDTDLLLETEDSSRTYRVRLHRRMRRDETHYIDHPKLGIIVRARRYEPPEPEPEPPAPAEPAAAGATQGRPEADAGGIPPPTPGAAPTAR